MAQQKTLTHSNTYATPPAAPALVRPNSRIQRWHMVLLVAILLAAFAIRMYGINFGLPYVYDPDESAFVLPALRVLADRDLNPHYFQHPGSTTIYILAATYIADFGAGLLTGQFRSPADFQALYYDNPTLFFLSGRIGIALFAVITILLVYLIGRRLFTSAAGLIAAAIVAVAPIHVSISRLIRTDVQMGFFVLVAFWFCLNILQKRSWSSYLWAGFFTGVAAMTKYPAALFVLVIAIAHLMVTPHIRPLKSHLKLMGSAVASVAGIVISSPTLIFNIPKVIQDMRIEMRTSHLSATSDGFLSNLAWYVGQVLTDNLTLVGLTLLIVGIYLCFTSKDRRKILLPLFPLIFIVFISASYLRWERWIVPIIPFAALIVGCALFQLVTWSRQRFRSSVTAGAACAALAVIAIPLSYTNLIEGNGLAGEDTRTVTREWIMAHLPAQSNILVEIYTPEMPSTLFNYYRVSDTGNMERYDPVSMNRKVFRPGGHIGRLNDLEQIRLNKIQYVVTSNIFDRYLTEQAKYPKEINTYQQALKQLKVIFEIQPEVGHRSGPPIHVYEVIEPAS